jgi:hypothetical protein
MENVKALKELTAELNKFILKLKLFIKNEPKKNTVPSYSNEKHVQS